MPTFFPKYDENWIIESVVLFVMLVFHVLQLVLCAIYNDALSNGYLNTISSGFTMVYDVGVLFIGLWIWKRCSAFKSQSKSYSCIGPVMWIFSACFFVQDIKPVWDKIITNKNLAEVAFLFLIVLLICQKKTVIRGLKAVKNMYQKDPYVKFDLTVLLIQSLYLGACFLDQILVNYKAFENGHKIMNALNENFSSVIYIITFFVLIGYVVKYLIQIKKRADNRYDYLYLDMPIWIEAIVIMSINYEHGKQAGSDLFSVLKSIANTVWSNCSQFLSNREWKDLEQLLLCGILLFFIVAYSLGIYRYIEYTKNRVSSNIFKTFIKLIMPGKKGRKGKSIKNLSAGDQAVFGLLFLLFLFSSLMSSVFIAINANSVVVNVIKPSKNLSYIELLEITLVCFASVTVFLVLTCIVFMIIKVLYYFCADTCDKIKYKSTFFMLIIMSFVIMGFLLVNFFSNNPIGIDDPDGWIDLVVNFDSFVMIFSVPVIIITVIYKIITAVPELFKSKSKNPAIEYLEEIINVLMDSVFGFCVFLGHLPADFFSNLNVTAYNVFSDKRMKEIKENHEMLDEKIAELMYYGLPDDMTLDELKSVEMNKDKQDPFKNKSKKKSKEKRKSNVKRSFQYKKHKLNK